MPDPILFGGYRISSTHFSHQGVRHGIITLEPRTADDLPRLPEFSIQSDSWGQVKISGEDPLLAALRDAITAHLEAT